MGKDGFSLLEVMVVVVIVGIIAAVAIPSYSGYVTRTRRAEAIQALQTVALYEERTWAETGSYVSEANLMARFPVLDPDGDGDYEGTDNYNIIINTVAATTFTARAVGQNQQAGDAYVFALDQDGTVGVYDGAGGVTSNPDLWRNLR